MPSWMKFSHPKGGYVNLDFLVGVQRRDDAERGQTLELRFTTGEVLLINEKHNKSLYAQFLKYLNKRVGIFVDVEDEGEMKLIKGVKNDNSQDLQG